MRLMPSVISARGGHVPACRRNVVFATSLLLVTALGTIAASDNLRLGMVNFATSGAVAAQPDFQRGVAALHSFWYEEAEAAFQRALAIDPGFEMARWGIAMTHNRPFLAGADEAAGRRALANIRDTSRLTVREVAYIDALRAYFSDQSLADRTLAHAAAMGKLYRDYPNDLEAAAFYALSLLGYRWANDEGFARQERAAAVALEVYRRNPEHPGAVHYIIHSFDEPALAARGLEAARQYAQIAPAAPHALHMPSHIFLQLGMWPEVAAANEAAWSASETWVRSQRHGSGLRDFHNLHWLIYAALQQGRYAHAAGLIRTFRAMRPDIPPESQHFLHRAVAAYVIETRDWSAASALFGPRGPDEPSGGRRNVEMCGGDPTQSDTDPRATADLPMFIEAFAAAALGLPDAERQLGALRKAATVENAMARFWGVRTLEVVALHRARHQDLEGAVVALRQAIALEERSGPSPGPPSSIKPPHELFGEILLAAGRPGEAVVQFSRTLERHPNRALAVLGRARAEAATDDRKAAVATYSRFLELWREADDNRAELREAREFVSRNTARTGS